MENKKEVLSKKLVHVAMLAGLYEVELNEVADSYKELITE